MFTLTLSRYFGSPGGSWLRINVVINWQLSKQDIRWPVSPDPIAGSGVDPLRSSIFLKLSADNLFVFKWLQAHVYFFKIHIKYVVFMLVSTRTITILISNWPQKQKFSLFKIQAGKTFSYHCHMLVTLHVQFLYSDWLKFDRWVHA